MNKKEKQDNFELFTRLMKTTNIPNAKPEDIDELHMALIEHPEFLRNVPEMADQALINLLETKGFTAFGRELTEQSLKQKKLELGYSQSSPVEKLLIGAVLISYARLQICEQKYNNNASGTTISEALFWDQRLNHCQNRFLKAVEKLAKVRKMIAPIQINIATQGGQQVNVSGDLVSKKE